MISYAQLWLLLFFQISLFIYFNLSPGPIRAKNSVNKQTYLEKQQQPMLSMADHAQLWEC